MNLETAALRIFEEFPFEESMQRIETLCGIDRYQASEGIERAADEVAEWAQRAGLKSVEITKHAGDGEVNWWSFRAPTSWTPVNADLSVGNTAIQFPRDALSLATHSAETPPKGLEVSLRKVDENRIDLVDGARLVGFVNKSAGERIDRVELPQDSQIFAFSVSSAAFAEIGNSSRGLARVKIRRTGAMPIVTGVIPGLSDDEVLLLGHLCHPRPGANDNASGVAAMTGIAKCISAWGSQFRSTIRFLWAPEFTGSAAFLHDTPLTPLGVINLDMVGEDQSLCGGPLIVERPPPHVDASLVELASESLTSLKKVRRDSWNWEVAEFIGASDHALFVDRMFSIPSVAFSHPDRFNHSSQDTVDKVSEQELRTCAAAAGASALVAAEAFRRPLAEVPQVPGPGALLRLWDGPFNLRGLFEELGNNGLGALGERGVFRDLVSVAHLIDDDRDRKALLAASSAEASLVHLFLDSMVSVGWIEELES